LVFIKDSDIFLWLSRLSLDEGKAYWNYHEPETMITRLKSSCAFLLFGKNNRHHKAKKNMPSAEGQNGMEINGDYRSWKYILTDCNSMICVMK